jgi:site-specific DNA recombinase
MSTLDPPLVPKRGTTLSVLMICRVSDPGEGKQRVESNDEQEQRLRSYLSDIWPGAASVRVIAGTGSGEFTDRDELLQADAAVESGEYDLVLCEDLGRISRRYLAQEFCEHAEDRDTRVIAVNGDVDTGRPNWRVMAGFAALRHELYNADTAQRIRRSHQGIFDKGGLIQHPIYGYLKPAGAKNDADLRKDPAAEPVYVEWFRRLKDGATFAEVADMLNAQGVPVGPCCRGQHWTSVMVGRITRNPILKGVRERNRKISRRVNRTGKYVAVRGRQMRQSPSRQPATRRDPSSDRLRYARSLSGFHATRAPPRSWFNAILIIRPTRWRLQ